MRLRLISAETRFDFMGRQRLAVAVSGALVALSLLAVAIFGLNLGIDFRGGTMIMAETEGEAEVARFRDTLTALNIGEVAVTRVSDPAADLTGAARNAVMIRIQAEGEDPGASAETIAHARAALQEAIPSVGFLSVESVGAKVSGELFAAGAIALLLAVGAILFYIWLRFEWQFAAGAVISLVHDVILTLGVFAVLQLEFNLPIIAALLTIIGYSLNDTVIVFDRVRENLRRFKTTALDEVLNLSINETLSRTLMTSGTTLVALISLYLLGGEVLRGFTFAMIWGILVGTYSSIFIAAVALSRLGVVRDRPEAETGAGVRFGSADAP